MPQDALPNGSAQDPAPEGPWSRVAGMQAKLHRWAAADPGRRFDDLFNFAARPGDAVCGVLPGRGQPGREHARRGRPTVRLVEERIGVQEFLDDLRAQLKAGTFRPLPASCVMDVISSGAGIIGGTLAVGVADGPGRRGRCGRGRVRSACR